MTSKVSCGVSSRQPTLGGCAKIVQLTSGHPPDDNRIFKICRSIANAGRQVSLIVPGQKDCLTAGVAIKTVSEPQTRMRRLLFTPWHVYRLAVREQARIYQFHDPELIPVGLALRWFHKRDVIYDVHEDVPDQILTKAWIPHFLRSAVATIFDRLEQYVASQLSAVVTANEDINIRLKDASRQLVTVHNYAEADEFSDVAAIDDSRYRSGVVFHCGASGRTSFPAVLRAIELVSQEIAVKLVATTPTGYESQAAADMVKSSPSSRVELLGLLPREQMLRIFLRCAVSLVLYDDQRNHSHIRSNRFFESLAAGVPVIVSDFPEWRKVVESIGCGLCVRPTDPQAIADALRILLTHPAEAEAMGKRGRCAFLKTFSWAPERNKLLALYNTLFTENPPTREIAATSQVA